MRNNLTLRWHGGRVVSIAGGGADCVHLRLAVWLGARRSHPSVDRGARPRLPSPACAGPPPCCVSTDTLALLTRAVGCARATAQQVAAQQVAAHQVAAKAAAAVAAAAAAAAARCNQTAARRTTGVGSTASELASAEPRAPTPARGASALTCVWCHRARWQRTQRSTSASSRCCRCRPARACWRRAPSATAVWMCTSACLSRPRQVWCCSP